MEEHEHLRAHLPLICEDLSGGFPEQQGSNLVILMQHGTQCRLLYLKIGRRSESVAALVFPVLAQLSGRTRSAPLEGARLFLTAQAFLAHILDLSLEVSHTPGGPHLLGLCVPQKHRWHKLRSSLWSGWGHLGCPHNHGIPVSVSAALEGLGTSSTG